MPERILIKIETKRDERKPIWIPRLGATISEPEGKDDVVVVLTPSSRVALYGIKTVDVADAFMSDNDLLVDDYAINDPIVDELIDIYTQLVQIRDKP